MYSLLLVIIYLAFISLGLPDSLLGSGWPAMHADIGASVASMGIVTMVISGCTILSSLLSDKLTRKLGTRTVTTISVFMTAAALFGFSFSTSFVHRILWAVPYGLCAGAIDAALNNYVALHYSSKHMSWLHCFWGVGTIVSPFVMSYALKSSVWNNGYRIVGTIQLVIAVILLVSFPVWKVNKDMDEKEKNKKRIGIFGAVKIKGAPTLLLGFFAYCAAEATAMGWAATYFSQSKSVDNETAARFASLFFIGLTASRFLCGFISNRLGDRKMIILGTAVIACGVILLAIPANTVALAVVAFIVIGFGCGPIYLSIIHSTPDNFGAEYSGAIIGIEMASAYVGSTFMPPLFGLLGSVVGYSVMPYFLLAFFTLMIVMVEITFRKSKGKREKERSE